MGGSNGPVALYSRHNVRAGEESNSEATGKVSCCFPVLNLVCDESRVSRQLCRSIAFQCIIQCGPFQVHQEPFSEQNKREVYERRR